MADNSTVSNIFGTLGAVCWSVQLIPQIILNYRRHSAAGLSSGFMLFWASAGIPMGVYNISSNFNIALQIQPQILTGLSLTTWSQCYFYEKKWGLWKVIAALTILGSFMGGIEIGLFFAIRLALHRGIDWPQTLMAVLAAALLGLGVLEQYLAIWKSRSVEGISFLFCGIDAMGDVTSIISVAFEPTINVLGYVMYGAEFVLWVGIFSIGFWLKCMPWLKTRLIETRKPTGAASEPKTSMEPHISLQGLPSSTSVFRTASGDGDMRERHIHHDAHHETTALHV